MGIRLDPSISWGDIGMGIGLLITGILAFTSLGERVTVIERDVQHVSAAVLTADTSFRQHVGESISRDQQIRIEVRQELRDLNQKIDRLIERVPNGEAR